MLESATPIPDNDIATIQIAVSGLIDNNLAGPQGICGIEIEFTHEYLGDLTITLISPSGTSVTLIGQPTTAIGPTNLANWDISFLPCATPAAPDPGFADVWSNLQPWQTLFPYSGSYHPNDGCLEDFDNGTANGIWQLVVQDHDEFQVGIIDSFKLIFCNPAGLVCEPCEPNAGILSPPSISICSGENIQSGNITIDYGGNTPPPALYSYQYLFVSGNTILQNGISFSFSPPAGMYTICGLSYLTTDLAAITTLIDSDDLSLLSQAIADGLVCADLTDDCISIAVSDQPDTMVINSQICNGETFSFGGQDYSSGGVFYQTHDGPGLCDTVFEIRIEGRTLNVFIPVPDTLNCATGNVDLLAIASGAMGPFMFQWSTVNGNITSPINGPSVQVDQSGEYFVNVTDGLCVGTGSVEVIADQGYPQIFFEGGTISCDQPVININPIYTPSNGTIVWTGPSGFTSNQPNISVTVPGVYQLMVTNEAGCTTARSEEIIGDTITYPIDIYILEKDCLDSTVVLANFFPERLKVWSWTGPNMFASNNWRPEVSDPGVYTLTGTFNNGCVRSGTFVVNADYTIPDIMISPADTLNCNEIISLSVSSGVPGVAYAWSGPLGFNTTMAMIQVSQAGLYQATVSSPNGCRNTDFVTVTLGDDIFDYEVFFDTVTCSNPSVTIGVITTDADVFDWFNYNGPDDSFPMIDVTAGGNYIVMMTDTNSGCTINAEISVPSNVVTPSFGYTSDTISCLNPVAELNFVASAGVEYTEVYWELPDMTIVQGPTLMSSLPGEHRLYGVGTNGCVGIYRINIPHDTLPPFVFLETDTLQCADTVLILSQSLDIVTQYDWSGPGIVMDAGDQISVDQPGWYHLSAYGLNGCPAEHDILVDSNFVFPVFTLSADLLRCDRPAELIVTPTNPVASYSWFGPAGNIVSSDSIAVITQPGEYTIEVVGLTGCASYDTVEVAALQFPFIETMTDTITCSVPTVDISVQVDISQYTIAWVDFNGDTLGNSEILSVSEAGPFIASVSGLNACETRDTILVPIDTIAPMAVIDLIGEVKCQIRDAVLDGSSSTPGTLAYAWSTVGGSILSDPTLTQINVRDTGFYSLHIASLKNGCVDSVTFYLEEDPDAITLAYLELTGPECSNEQNGVIAVTGLDGGIGPFQYQLNGGALQANPIFDDLDAGTFLLTISDAENCIFDTTVVIDPTVDFTIDAGPDQDIYLGESAFLNGETSLESGSVQMDAWISISSVLCENCADFEVTPLETTSYVFQVTSQTGCVKEDEVTVYVIEKAKYYIANIFSPNGDGINDEVSISPSPGLQRILRWIIFDRWGNAVYGKTDFDPSDPSVFWNGQASTGEFVNPGVFPYMIEIQLINGKTEWYHGDITVIR